jgi:hypothetical protein
VVSRQCLIDTTTAAQANADRWFQPISHDRRQVFRPKWTGLKRIAVIAGTVLVIFIVFAVAIYVGVFVILTPDDAVPTPTQRVRHSSWV